MDLNKVMIIGRLTRDPELRTTPSGINVCQLGVATNFVYNNQQTGQKVENVEYHNIVLWRKLGEIANQYLKKGRRVYIEGRLQTRSWDGKDGQKKYRTEIVGDNMIMLDSGGAGGQRQENAGNEEPPAPEEAPQSPAKEDIPTIQQDEDINVEDIPF
ncbi:MAG: single-stranded DNA-binding protein [Candidatus Doudnabacteria bacterium CG10_big_fil_rev_8_21_14_0_10_42_18]|uniref:Single-stranded DNA-binding protein n=1 Tax=Candidatus Doudnabacteria bacterium CG10_big_fil_rev_8_21_14_0_10_42_18 TaxID=1974552 RepID=A0A2H0VBD7_9BACT|nr:MAG: single-stranded DNA-binding protein [Candidatus Doudnabacteria bacterium CG10_big_fil_rev_8_21_14_0_10_42_18]